MCSKDFLAEIQRKFSEAFESQNPELFDVVFDFDGKKLYADKFRLSLASTTFESMLSDRWTSKNDVIKIESYKFEEFKELLAFLYTGECKLNDENIFAMLDISEFYQIQHLKELCDQYLSKRRLKLSNIFQFIEISDKYSLIQAKTPIFNFIFRNFTNFVKSDQFLNVDKSVIKLMVTMKSVIVLKREEIFEAVYEWAEHQASIKKHEEENFNLNDAIKNELTEFLPFIEFEKMPSSFLTQYVVKRGFIFSCEDLSDILECVRSSVKVKVTNLYGQSIYGKFSHKDVEIMEAVKSLNNCESDNHTKQVILWDKKCKKPSTPSPLKKRDGVHWYLIHGYGEIIAIQHHSDINRSEYLMAEMFSDTNFMFTPQCKIEID